MSFKETTAESDVQFQAVYKYQISNVQFQAIYERQVSRVYKICYSYLDNSYDIQDAVQNVFIKLLEKKVHFADESYENAWFYLTARKPLSGYFEKLLA